MLTILVVVELLVVIAGRVFQLDRSIHSRCVFIARGAAIFSTSLNDIPVKHSIDWLYYSSW